MDQSKRKLMTMLKSLYPRDDTDKKKFQGKKGRKRIRQYGCLNKMTRRLHSKEQRKTSYSHP